MVNNLVKVQNAQLIEAADKRRAVARELLTY